MDALITLTQTFIKLEKDISNKQLKEFLLFVDSVRSARSQKETNTRLRSI